jgi:ABC-type nitrate/sulfonate/bicarbonate transport system permease component
MAARVLVFAVAIALWQLAASGDWAGPDTIPTPHAVLDALGTLIGEGSTWAALQQTMVPWVAGVAITMVAGVLLGLLLGFSRFAYASTRGLFDFLRAVPPVALIPLALLIVGVSDTLKIVLIVNVCLWPVLLQTMYGVRAIDPMARDVAQALGMNRVQTNRWIVVPSILPYLGTALRLAAILALLVTIGTELLAGVPGLGFQIGLDQSSNALADVYALVLIVAVIGLVISQALALLERTVLRWHPAHRSP